MLIKKVSIEKVTSVYKNAEDAELSNDWKKLKKESEDKNENIKKEDMNGSN